MISRRSALAAIGAAPFLTRFHALTAPLRTKAKIREIRTMVLSGPRTYTLVKVETDAGPFGIAEAYGSPGAGVREQIHALREFFIGKDPTQIDTLIVGLGRHSDGSAHHFMRAVAGIEMALWDVTGHLLGVPVSTLLGGRFRDRVRVYNHASPKNMLDKASVREWAAQCNEDPSGFTAHKFGLQHTDIKKDAGRDVANRLLSTTELRNARTGFENCREAIGWTHDIMVHSHWEYDLRTSIQLAEAVADIRPLWLEDPLPVAWTESWRALCQASRVPLCTGENWFRRAEAVPFVVNNGVDILNPDLRNSGGFLETKRMAEFADAFSLPVANHNTGSVVNTMATVQWASAIRDYTLCETVVGRRDWMDDVILHDGPLVRDGFIDVPDKPGLGIALNPDVVRAHLAHGEKWWD